MLGNKLGEEHGKVTSRRILPGEDYRYVKMEISFESQGHFFGVDTTHMGTFTAFERIPGQIYGEGNGIWMTADGEGAIWNGHGIGTAMPDGSIKFAASLCFQSGEGKLAPLSKCLILIEQTTAADGTVSSVAYEWKA